MLILLESLKLSNLVHFLLGMLQLSVAAVILVAIFHGVRIGFNFSRVHPDDVRRAYKMQRINCSKTGAPEEYLPRTYIWVSIIFFCLCAIAWFFVYRCIGLLLFQ